MLDGELLIEAGEERRLAAAGHVAVLPRDQVHTFLVVSATARYLTLHTPAGFEAFVRDVSGLSDAAGAGGAGGAAPDRAALVALAWPPGTASTSPAPA